VLIYNIYKKGRMLRPGKWSERKWGEGGTSGVSVALEMKSLNRYLFQKNLSSNLFHNGRALVSGEL